MRHAWILDVLADLRAYADKNNLPRIAEAAEQARRVAVAEIAAADIDDGGRDGRASDEGVQ